MSKTRIYDLVKQLLEDNEELRNSDKRLIWRVWQELHLIHHYQPQNMTVLPVIDYYSYLDAPSTESVRRARQLIQARYPELQATKRVRSYRHQKEESKGTFAYREEISFSESVKEQMNLI